VSERHLRRYIEYEFGQPPHTWMMQQRLRKARKLLSDGSFVKVVSVDLGFKTPEHFSTAFKKQFGISPRAFRLRLIEELKKGRSQF
jgi:AraC-like DNA-binding protein